MPTSPEQVRTGLSLITAASVAEVEAVARSFADPVDQVAALFATTPLIIADYLDGSSALALDWYEELREESRPTSRFTPSPVTLVRDDQIATTVGWATRELREAEAEALEDIDRLAEEMLTRLTPTVQREVAAGFWDTITENVAEDPDAVGWKRYARAGACPFCRMLADKGAIFRADTATFAAHTSCHCVAAPAFGTGAGPEASAMQYVASSRTRSPAAQARLREYLRDNYGA